MSVIRKKTLHISMRRRTTGIIAVGFLMIIVAGALLLSLPLSSASGEGAKPIDALFTSVSAACVTGSVTVDTATHWSLFGQLIILLLVQVGGLGFMTVAVLLSLLVKRAVTPKERMLVAMSYNISSYEKIGELLQRIWIGTLAIELAGGIALSVRFIPVFGVWDGIYKSVFTSVSAFCNAGFDLFGGYGGTFSSLGAFAGDYLVNITVMALIIIGGIGFIVWNDIANVIVRKKPMSVYSRFVLIITSILIIGGGGLFALLEWDNPASIGGMSVGGKILTSLFQSVSMRTAGFVTVGQGALRESSQFLSVILMFIGGASGSTAGGVKVATVGIIIYTLWSVSIGRREAVLFGRRISPDSFTRAVAVAGVQLLMLGAGSIAISASMGCGIFEAVYEASGALGTTGLSLGMTPLLNSFSKIVLMALMYFGRVGVLTVTYAVMVNLREGRSAISYPDANMLVG